MSKGINIIFDGPPSHESGRFVEVENDGGRSISVGEWIERGDGLWALRLETYFDEITALREQLLASEKAYRICNEQHRHLRAQLEAA